MPDRHAHVPTMRVREKPRKRPAVAAGGHGAGPGPAWMLQPPGVLVPLPPVHVAEHRERLSERALL